MTDIKPVNEPLENPDIAFEQSDANIRRSVFWGGAVLVLIFVAMLVGLLMIGGFSSYRAAVDPTPPPMAQFRPTPPLPRLQPNPVDRQTAEQELAIMKAEEDFMLNSYGWVDRQGGIVRIPIERAMQLLAEDKSLAPEPAK